MKILSLTDYSRKTAFGLQMDYLLNNLSSEHQCALLGWGHTGDELETRGSYTVFPAIGTFGEQSFGSAIQMFKPDILITMADTRMIEWMVQFRSKDANNLPLTWVNYPVIDGHIWDIENTQEKWPSNWTDFMKLADFTVAHSYFGQRVLKRMGIESTVIPHMIDANIFKPIPPEQKAQVRANLGLPANTFVVGFNFKNMMRKEPEKFLQILTLLRKDHPDIIGLMHTNLNRQFGGEFDLPQIAKDYGLAFNKDVFATPVGLPYPQMNLWYNCLDVYLSPVGGESFQVPLIEAMAAGTPIVTTDYTTAPEICGDCGELINVPTYPGTKTPITFGSYNGVEFAIPDIFDAKKKVLKLYDSKELREKYSLLGSQKAMKLFSVEAVIPQWKEFLKKAEGLEELPDEWKEKLGLIGESPVEVGKEQ